MHHDAVAARVAQQVALQGLQHLGTALNGAPLRSFPGMVFTSEMSIQGGARGVAVLAALPCSTRKVMRLLSMSETFSKTTSLTRSPVA